jgi:2-amino-4-hydroxy-6-hydroxymethyldihydropteridine diphosphokinase
MIRCFIALGSNLNNPLAQVEQAITALSELPQSRLGKRSPWYQSAALGPGEQVDYINGAVELFTTLEPIALLNALQAIEHAQGRERKEHWGPRTLDLDLLLYGQQRIELPRLTVPHAELTVRNFVLQPLCDIDASLCLPDGSSVSQHLNNCPSNPLTCINPSQSN